MQDLLEHPRWTQGDLGKPLPDSLHATSVCMPTWGDVIGYEEGDPRVLEKLYCGYPRFFPHSRTAALFDEVTSRMGRKGERGLVFPCFATALRCQEYVERSCPGASRLLHHAIGDFSVLLAMGEQAFEQARRYWRFAGELVGSRQADLLLKGRTPAPRVSACGEGGMQAHDEIKERLARHAGQSPSDIYLFPSGMAAVFAVHRMLMALRPGLPTVQVDFPYVDVLKVQEEFGAEKPVFLPTGSPEELRSLEEKISCGCPVAGIFGEVPSNPLLRCVDTDYLRRIADLGRVPLVLDDTIGTSINIDAASRADIVTTSLTKYFSGAGDVLAGSVILVRNSSHYEEMTSFLRDDKPVGLSSEDAAVLAENSRDFADRVRKSSASGAVMADFLNRQEVVDYVWYPSTNSSENYARIARNSAGMGGMVSFALRGGEPAAQKCYDRLRVSKGPSLGMNFTLACPYTLLAHYHELEWAQSVGVPRHLIRLSVGLEEPDDLLERLEEALC